MAKGSPSLVALLGLLAVAGYQHRDKLGDILNGHSPDDATGDPRAGAAGSGPQGSILDSFRQAAGGVGGGGLMAGLSELFGRFAAPDQQAKVQTWVRQGPNDPLAPDELEQALDEETITELVAKTGLSREDLLSRLSSSLPEAVDQVTPEGEFPPVSMREPRSV